MLEGDSLFVDDSLGMEASYGDDGSKYISDSMPQEGL